MSELKIPNAAKMPNVISAPEKNPGKAKYIMPIIPAAIAAI